MEDNTPSATMDMGAMVGDVIPELVLVIGGVFHVVRIDVSGDARLRRWQCLRAGNGGTRCTG